MRIFRFEDLPSFVKNCQSYFDADSVVWFPEYYREKILKEASLGSFESNGFSRIESEPDSFLSTMGTKGDITEMKDITQDEMMHLFKNSYKGNTMYVVPFCVGRESEKKFGVQITDSVQVAIQASFYFEMVNCDENTPLPLSFPLIHSKGNGGEKFPQVYYHHSSKFPSIWSFGSTFMDDILLSTQNSRLSFFMNHIDEKPKIICTLYKVSKIKHKPRYILEHSFSGDQNYALFDFDSVGGWNIELIYHGFVYVQFIRGAMEVIVPNMGSVLSMDMHQFKTISLEKTLITVPSKEKTFVSSFVEDLKKGQTIHNMEWPKHSRIIKRRLNDAYTSIPIDGFLWPYEEEMELPLIYESMSWNEGVFIGSIHNILTRHPVFDPTYFKTLMSSGVSPKTQFFFVHTSQVNEEANMDSISSFEQLYSERYQHIRYIFERIFDLQEGEIKPIPWNPSSTPQIFKRIEKEIRPKYIEHNMPGALMTILDRLIKGSGCKMDFNNLPLDVWVEKMEEVCQPDAIHWCDGSDEENQKLCDLLVKSGTFIKLNEQKRPNSYLARSDPRDVARVESRTFICTYKKEDAGPTNNWCDSNEKKKEMEGLFDGCMKGRTMYVIPFLMGPLGSKYSKFGVQITDSPYVVVNMRIMVRMGNKILQEMLNNKMPYLPCLHSVGKPLEEDEVDVPWPCNPEKTCIAHFPEDPSVMSYGSGYGGNALLGKKCYSLRIATTMGRKNEWLAEHMLILGMTNPQGEKFYISAAFPSACGKTNLAMLVPTIPGWKVHCVGDDIAWLHVGENGKLLGINPEAGFFGVAPGTSLKSNASAMETIRKNTIFTNVGLTPDGDIWWEGMTDEPPPELIDWRGEKWTPGCGRTASHPNARYTTPAYQCPVIDPEWENPDGVPISAIIFGGRRRSLYPLVTEALSWSHGVFMGSTVSSEQTAASEGTVGQVRRDPFAMLPFCGYNMGDYFQHWIDFRHHLGYNCPKIFYVNWFRKDSKGKFVWPGFGENSRVLKWITQRLGRNPVGRYERTPIGYIPSTIAFDMTGLHMSEEKIDSLFHIDISEWKNEVKSIHQYYNSFGQKLPKVLMRELKDLEKRLSEENHHEAPTKNKKLIWWVKEMRKLCKPQKIHWCTGTEEENKDLCNELVKSGTFIKLNEQKRPNSYLARSDPRDVARVEAKTFICTEEKEDAGPTNNWRNNKEMKETMLKLFDGSMKGRTMYIIPFLMGPLGSKYSKFGVQITDSPYVVVNMRIMTRMGTKVLNSLNDRDFFLPCLHSVGKPLEEDEVDVPWPCNPEKTCIAHFPEDPSVMSYGSGYGGNALLGKKCYSLRLASVIAKKEGWLAEHMLILCLTNPQGKKYYMTAAFPSACGKTNLAMMVPSLKGWSLKCIGDDIAWLHINDDGRLHAINPESGFFGVAPGTSFKSNASAMETIRKNTIFTNVGLTPDGDIWWEGMTDEPPSELIDWRGEKWTPGCGRTASHPNARYTTPASQCPVIDPEWENPDGVPICAMLFGGRREKLIPLVTEAYIWEQGVFMASTISSEQTAASEGTVGQVRRDPFAMLPFCGYNMGDYFQHWIDFRKNLGFLSPKIFYVNWFRKHEGKFVWPGFGENSRVLKWITERVDGTGKAKPTALGYVPTLDGLDLEGIDDRIKEQEMKLLTEVDRPLWKMEIPSIRKYYKQFGERFPEELFSLLDDLEYRLFK